MSFRGSHMKGCANPGHCSSLQLMVIDGNQWTTMLRIPDSYDAKTDNSQVFVIVCVSKTDRWFGKRAKKPQNRAQKGKRTIQPHPGVVLFVRSYEHNVFFLVINARLRDPEISIYISYEVSIFPALKRWNRWNRWNLWLSYLVSIPTPWAVAAPPWAAGESTIRCTLANAHVHLLVRIW